MPLAPYVTVGVPVYRGTAFITETLRSIQQQTHQNLRVIISMDGPDPDSEQLCRGFLSDARFELVVQPERLGWVGNVNWLMAQAATPFWYLNPQDDLVDPRYVETLLDEAQRMPEAAVIYSDIAAFGTLNPTITQSSITGSPFARQFTLLHEHHSAVAFRGLTRIQALLLSGPIRANEIESFSSDTTWMAAMARWGDLQRVPMALYHKRYHPNNEHVSWLAWPPEKLRKAWMVHCVNMLEQAMLVDATVQERRLLWLACVGRLLSPRFGFLAPADEGSTARLSLLESFLNYIEAVRYLDIPALLDESWNSIRQWTQDFLEISAALGPEGKIHSLP